jgi:murein DD-endopeptidase MepM/ murein hydrolase activator NlpD
MAQARTPFQLTANFSLASPEEVAKAAMARPSPGGSPWGRLVEGSARLTSEFGHRTDPFTGRPDYHRGIDLAADFGARVRPYAPGVVTFSGWQPGYGKLVIVRHDDGLETAYGHNASNLVRRGDSVDADTVIALVGSTGRSTGPHLHFEVRENGEPVDPVPYLSGGSFQVARR